MGLPASQIRAKTYSDLICRSSSHKRAEVTLYIGQKQSGRTAKITRWVAEEGSKCGTGYLINGVEKAKGEVVEALQAIGIDPQSSHNLIYQEKVTKFAELRPKASSKTETGLCELVERVVGIRN